MAIPFARDLPDVLPNLRWYDWQIQVWYVFSLAAAICAIVFAVRRSRSPFLWSIIVFLALFVYYIFVYFGVGQYFSGWIFPAVRGDFFMAIIGLVLGFIGWSRMPNPALQAPWQTQGMSPHPSGGEDAAHAWRVAQIKDQDAAHAWRVAQIKEWERAYRDAHDGAEPPPGFMPPIAMPGPTLASPFIPPYGMTGPNPASTRTNSLAVAALIFGLLGGFLGIIFGIIALNQIKRTGESGKGMATAGIICAIAWIIIALVIFSARDSYYYY